MALWQELMAKWEKEELVDVDNDPFNPDDEPEWDGYERSILKKLADEVKIGIQGHTVDITVSKRFNIQD